MNSTAIARQLLEDDDVDAKEYVMNSQVVYIIVYSTDLARYYYTGIEGDYWTQNRKDAMYFLHKESAEAEALKFWDATVEPVFLPSVDDTETEIL